MFGDPVETFKATDVVFVHVLVQCRTEGDVHLDTGDPFVNAAFNLQRRRQINYIK